MLRFFETGWNLSVDRTPIIIDFPGLPLAKERARARAFAVNGKPRAMFYTPSKTREYTKQLADEARKVMGERIQFHGPVSLTLVVTRPFLKSWSKEELKDAQDGIKKPTTKPDLDNYTKLVKDALNTVVYNDDAQVVYEIARKQYGLKPGLLISVRPLGRED